MTKTRVHEYARQVKKTSKEVIEELGKMNISVTNHMSTIDSDTISKLDKTFGGNKEGQGARPAAKSSAGNTRPGPSSKGGQNRPAATGSGQRPSPRWTKPSSCNR